MSVINVFGFNFFFLECFIVNLNMSDDFVYVWRDHTSNCYPWVGYWGDKFTGLGPGGGPPVDGSDLWPLSADNFRHDDNKYKKSFNPSEVEVLKDIKSLEGYIIDRFGPEDQRSLGGIGPKQYLKDIDSIISVGSNRFYQRLHPQGDLIWSEFGLKMNIHTKGEKIFDHAIVHYPGNLSVRVNDESNLVKINLKQRDIAGLHFFKNGTGIGQLYRYRMEKLYNLTLKNQDEINTVVRYNKIFELYNKKEECWNWNIKRGKLLVNIEGQNTVKKYINKKDQGSVTQNFRLSNSQNIQDNQSSVHKDFSLSNLVNKQDNNRSTNSLSIFNLVNKEETKSENRGLSISNLINKEKIKPENRGLNIPDLINK